MIPLLLKKGCIVEEVQNKGYKIIISDVVTFIFYPGTGRAYFPKYKSWSKISLKWIKEKIKNKLNSEQ